MDDTPLNEEIERLFLEAKRKVAPRWFSHPKYIANYQKAADICAANGISAALLIKTVFNDFDGKLLLPNMLHSKDILSRVETYSSTLIEESYADRFKQNLVALQKQEALGFKEDQILLTTFIGFDAWFRICYPSKLIPEVYKKFAAEAKAQYNDPRLREFLVSKNLNPHRLL